jgi:hypothetical protein
VPWTATLEERRFVVAEVLHCERRCLGCNQNVRLVDWPGRHHAKLCADHLGPGLRGGDRLVMRGRFSSWVIAIEALERAPVGS